MARNKITDLRDHLFETLEGLKDTEKPMDLGRAHAICEVSQQIINSAKVEVDMLRAVDARRPSSGFFGLAEGVEPAEPKNNNLRRLPTGT